ncbi:MAG: type II toxin-antitoxin system VapC family toxin [Burkholderiales bacterium]|jgi:predicted nucleic acid-binding protein|nr:type II toxin-antitoxin system VapC family toxin [Burkholderiales bacterium]
MKPVAVDTNVLVRLATGDHAAEHRTALASLAARPWRVLPTVLLETEWVLRSVYRFSPAQFADFVEWMDASGRVVLEQVDVVRTAAAHHRTGMDFADALHLAQTNGEPFLTFDKALQKKAARLKLNAQAVA